MMMLFDNSASQIKQFIMDDEEAAAEAKQLARREKEDRENFFDSFDDEGLYSGRKALPSVSNQSHRFRREVRRCFESNFRQKGRKRKYIRNGAVLPD